MNASKTTVLVVDDEDELRMTLVTDLNEAGYLTLDAADGYQALEKLKNNKVDIVLSDLKMPELTGIQLLKTMRVMSFFQPFIVLSGFGTREEIVELLRLGAFDFLEKPIRYEDLVSVVGEAAALTTGQQATRTELLQSLGVKETEVTPQVEGAIRQLSRLRTLRATKSLKETK